jgi:hypothetical protein
MAQYQLNLLPGDFLKPADRRVPGVNRLLLKFASSTFFAQFSERYCTQLCLDHDMIRNVLKEQQEGRGLQGATKGHHTEQSSSGQSSTDQKEKGSAGADLPSLRKTSPSVIFEIYEAHRGCLPESSPTESRLDKARVRLGDPKFAADLERALHVANETPFLQGKNDRAWMPGLDWFLANDRNVKRVLEGTYGIRIGATGKAQSQVRDSRYAGDIERGKRFDELFPEEPGDPQSA